MTPGSRFYKHHIRMTRLFSLQIVASDCRSCSWSFVWELDGQDLTPPQLRTGLLAQELCEKLWSSTVAGFVWRQLRPTSTASVHEAASFTKLAWWSQAATRFFKCNSAFSGSSNNRLILLIRLQANLDYSQNGRITSDCTRRISCLHLQRDSR